MGMEPAQEDYFPVALTQEDLTKNLNFLHTRPKLRTGRKGPLSEEGAKTRKSKLGELCWLAAVSRPDFYARLAKIASRINSLRGSDIHRIGDLVREEKEWRQTTALKYASSSRPRRALDFAGKPMDGARTRGVKAHCGKMSRAGWSDASNGDRLAKGERRLGYAIRFTPSS